MDFLISIQRAAVLVEDSDKLLASEFANGVFVLVERNAIFQLHGHFQSHRGRNLRLLC